MIARGHRCAGAIRIQDEGLKAAANHEGGDPVTELVRERGEQNQRVCQRPSHRQPVQRDGTDDAHHECDAGTAMGQRSHT